MDIPMAQVHKNFILRNKIDIPTIFGLRSPVNQKTFSGKCVPCIVARVEALPMN